MLQAAAVTAYVPVVDVYHALPGMRGAELPAFRTCEAEGSLFVASFMPTSIVHDHHPLLSVPLAV